MSDFSKLVFVAVFGLGALYWVVLYVAQSEFGVQLPDPLGLLN